MADLMLQEHSRAMGQAIPLLEMLGAANLSSSHQYAKGSAESQKGLWKLTTPDMKNDKAVPGCIETDIAYAEACLRYA